MGLNSIEESFKTVNPRHCAMMAVHPLSIHLQIIYSRWISNFIQWKRTSQFCNNKYFNYIQHNLFHNTYIDSTTHTFYSTTHTFHNDHPHRRHSLQLLKPYFTRKHYYFYNIINSYNYNKI